MDKLILSLFVSVDGNNQQSKKGTRGNRYYSETKNGKQKKNVKKEEERNEMVWHARRPNKRRKMKEENENF
jgi:hypothetical protein